MIVQILILVLVLFISREQLNRMQSISYDEICSVRGPIVGLDEWDCEIPAFSVVEISPGDNGGTLDGFSASFYSLCDAYGNMTEHVFSTSGPGMQEDKFELFNLRTLKISRRNCSLPTYNSKITFYQRNIYKWPISLILGIIICVPFVIWIFILTTAVNLGKNIILSTIQRYITYAILIALLTFMSFSPSPVIQQTNPSPVEFFTQQINLEKDRIIQSNLQMIQSKIWNSFKELILWYYNMVKDILLALFLSKPQSSSKQQLNSSQFSQESNFDSKPLLIQIIQLIYTTLTSLIKEGWRLFIWLFSIRGPIRSVSEWSQKFALLHLENSLQFKSVKQKSLNIIEEDKQKDEQTLFINQNNGRKGHRMQQFISKIYQPLILFTAMIFLGIVFLFFGFAIYHNGILLTPLLLFVIFYTHVQCHVFAFRSGHDLISKISEQIFLVSQSSNNNIGASNSKFINLFAAQLDITFIIVIIIFVISIYLLFHNTACRSASQLINRIIGSFFNWIFTHEIPSEITDHPGIDQNSYMLKFLKEQKRNEKIARWEQDKILSQNLFNGRISVDSVPYILLLLCFSSGILFAWSQDEQMYQKLTIVHSLLTFLKKIIQFLEFIVVSKNQQWIQTELGKQTSVSYEDIKIMRLEVFISIILTIYLISISILTHVNIYSNSENSNFDLEQSIFESLKGRKLFGKKNDSEKNSDNIRNLISIFGKEQHNHAIIDFQKALHSLNTQSFLILLLLLIIFLGDSSSVFDPTLDARPGSTSSYTAQSPLRSSPFWVTSLSQSPFQNGTTVGGKTIIIPRLITDVTLYTNTDYGKDQRKGYSNEIGNDDSDSLDSGFGYFNLKKFEQDKNSQKQSDQSNKDNNNLQDGKYKITVISLTSICTIIFISISLIRVYFSQQKEQFNLQAQRNLWGAFQSSGTVRNILGSNIEQYGQQQPFSQSLQINEISDIIRNRRNNSSKQFLEIFMSIMRLIGMLGLVLAMHATYTSNNYNLNYLNVVHKAAQYMTFIFGKLSDKQLEAKIHDNIEEKQRYEEAFKSFTPLSAALSSYSVIPINLFVEIGIPLCVIYFTSWVYSRKTTKDIHKLRRQSGRLIVSEDGSEKMLLKFSFLESITQINLWACIITSAVGILLLYHGCSYRKQFIIQQQIMNLKIRSQLTKQQYQNNLCGIITGCKASGNIEINSRHNLTIFLLFSVGVLMQCLLTVFIDWFNFRIQNNKKNEPDDGPIIRNIIKNNLNNYGNNFEESQNDEQVHFNLNRQQNINRQTNNQQNKIRRNRSQDGNVINNNTSDFNILLPQYPQYGIQPINTMSSTFVHPQILQHTNLSQSQYGIQPIQQIQAPPPPPNSYFNNIRSSRSPQQLLYDQQPSLIQTQQQAFLQNNSFQSNRRSRSPKIPSRSPAIQYYQPNSSTLNSFTSQNQS